MAKDGFAELLGILRRFYNPREEGWIWLVTHVPGEERGVVSQLEGVRPGPGMIIEGLSNILRHLGPMDVLIAICRSEGRPTEADRMIWRALRDTSAGTETTLIDAVIFNREGFWSMREEDAQSNAVA